MPVGFGAELVCAWLAENPITRVPTPCCHVSTPVSTAFFCFPFEGNQGLAAKMGGGVGFVKKGPANWNAIARARFQHFAWRIGFMVGQG